MIVPDSSILVAALASHHDWNRSAAGALRDVSGLIVHAAFEACSVLSRLPEGWRLEAPIVLAALEDDFPQPWLALDQKGHHGCLRRAVDAGIRGGALYDALIAATAAEHDVALLSADRRASATYEAMGARVEYLQP